MANRCREGLAGRAEQPTREECATTERSGDAGGMAHPAPGGQRIDGGAPGDAGHTAQREPDGGMEHAEGEQVGIPGCAREPRGTDSGVGHADGSTEKTVGGIPEGPFPHATGGFWASAEWLPCRDGKARPIEPSTVPLAHGIAGRVGRLRAYGNSLCAPVAVEFVKAAMEVCP
jgi:DNA (cytosine-5)-methyltransferase 1